MSQLVLRMVEDAQHVPHETLPCAHALQLHAEAGVPHRCLPFGAQLQVEGMTRGWVQGNEQAAYSVVLSGTEGTAHSNGWLKPWHELILGSV